MRGVMTKYCLVASFLLCAFHAAGDPISTLLTTSLDWSARGGGPNIDFTASSPTFVIQGSEGIAQPFPNVLVGDRIGNVRGGFGFESGVQNLNLFGRTDQNIPIGFSFGDGFTVSGTIDLLVPATPTRTTVTFPGTAMGEFTAFGCSITDRPPTCTGPQVANIIIDLPGLISITYGPSFDGVDRLLEETAFTGVASVPEPSGVLLSLLGAVTTVGISLRRRQRAKRRKPLTNPSYTQAVRLRTTVERLSRVLAAICRSERPLSRACAASGYLLQPEAVYDERTRARISLHAALLGSFSIKPALFTFRYLG